MEKTINVCGKDVVFKSSGSLPLRYKMQFKKDFFADIINLEKSYSDNSKTEINFDEFDSEIVYNICWTLAKIADNCIPSPLEWLDTFDSFPLMDILPEIQDLLISSITSTKQLKN